MSKPVVVDIHAHLIPRELLDPLWNGRFCGFNLREVNGDTALMIHGRRIATVITPKYFDLGLRLSAMDEMGIAVQAISLLPPLTGYHLPEGEGLRFCQTVNDAIALAVSAYPTRFVGIATAPLQDPAEAVRELRRALGELGLRGVQIVANVQGVELGDESLLPFWEAVVERDCHVFVHPNQGNMPALERLGRYNLANLVGNPLDTTLAMASLIWGGHLDRWPELKLCFAHGGGFLAYQIGRFDHYYETRADLRQEIPQPPSSYFRKLFFDTVLFSRDALSFLVSQVGPGQVLLGTDTSGGEVAETNPVKLVADIGLGFEAQAAVLGGNAARLLGLRDLA